MTDDTVERVGNAALEHMFDRKGIQEILEPIRDEDPEVWNEIVEETARAAIAAMPQQEVTVKDAAKVLLDAEVEKRLDQSPAIFSHFHEWEGYKRGVQEYTAALSALSGQDAEGET